MSESYTAFVKSLVAVEPGLRPLAEAMMGGCRQSRTGGGIRCLEVHNGTLLSDGSCLRHVLPKIRQVMGHTLGQITGLLIMVEDIHPTEIEELGSLLDINPRFFCDHLSKNSFYELEKCPPTDFKSSLPSRAGCDNMAHFRYQRVLDLGDQKSLGTIPYSLCLDGNVRRQVRGLPPSSGRHVGLARACFSIIKKKFGNGKWICIMLMDSSTADVVSDTSDTNKPVVNFRAYQSPYRICFTGNELPSYSYFTTSSHHQALPRMAMLDEVAMALMSKPVPLHTEPDLVQLAQHPLQIIVSEWMLYSLLIGRYTKSYEFSIAKLQKTTGSEYDNTMSSLYRWQRRSQQSLEKLRQMKWFLKHQQNHEISNLLIEDVDHISDQIGEYRAVLQSMIPTLTSMVQLIDTRRAMKETIYVKHLTYIALVFLPLSFVASIFSMNEDFAVNTDGFKVYLATAIPLLTTVLVISSVSFRMGSLVNTVASLYMKIVR